MKKLKPFLVLLLIAGVFACEEVLEVTDISEDNVVLLAPSNNVVVEQSEINFTWNEVFDAEEYHVQIAQPSFENTTQIVLDSIVVVDSTLIGTRITKSLIDNNYEWRVKAMNSGFETPYATSNFQVNTSGN